MVSINFTLLHQGRNMGTIKAYPLVLCLAISIIVKPSRETIYLGSHLPYYLSIGLLYMS